MEIHPVWVMLCRLVGLCLAGVVGLALCGEVYGAEADSTRVDAAFERLIAEAKELGTLKVPEHRAVFTRPHRVVRELEPGDGTEVLRRLDGKLVGDLYGDTYIRWHLLPVVHDWLHKRAVDSTDDPLPADSIKALRHLFEDMPAEAKTRFESPLSKEGKRIESRLVGLRSQTTVIVGVPPFEKRYSGRAALPHMTPSARRRAEPIVKQLEALQNQLKQMRSREVDKLNERYREMAKAFREYRGDLAYAMVQTGEGKALGDVGSAVVLLIRKRQRAGFDLMRSTYRAMHDGYLGRYDDRALGLLRTKLRKAAAGAQKYERYNRGDEALPTHVRPKMRSFGVYAAHLIGLLESPGRVRGFTLANRIEAGEPVLVPAGPFDPDSLSIEDVRAAIGAAVHELYTAEHQRSEAKAKAILPHEGLRHDSYYWWLNRYEQSKPRYQEVVYETGNHALVCWAMLAAGQSYQDPRLYRRISWVLSGDTPFTYDRGMRLMMLSRLSGESFGPWARRDADWLASSVTDKGNFNSEYFGGPSTGFGDHGSGFYGVLGLWGADKLGIELNNKKVWSPIDTQWRLTQQKTPGDQAAGWAVGMLASVGGGGDTRQASAKITRSTVSSPMTAAGVASLTLTERYLNGPKLTDPTKDNVSPELRKGLRWLDENFDPAQSFGADWYYSMWTIQRVGRATGRRTFNGVDWFRHVTSEMLSRQGSDGLWEDASGRQGKLLSTGFALLYLANALEPVAVSKVRFDGRWDNRPNDLWNFAEYASDVYEVDTAWQIVGLDQPMQELADSPLLYLATNEPFTLSDAEIGRLREYIDAGGMLVFNPEAPWGRLSGSVDALVEALYPGRGLEEVAGFHPFYSLHAQLRPTVQMRMVHNGVRPLVVAFTKDIGRGLQVNDLKRHGDSFVAMSNIYLFAVGTEPRRVRLETDYVSSPGPPVDWPDDKMSVARVRYDGDYDPEPGALGQLRAVMARDQGVDLVVGTVGVDELADERVAFLTTAGGGALTDDEAEALRAWVQAGGTLWLDAAGGTPAAVEAAGAMLVKLFPDRVPTPIADDSPIITGRGLGMDAHDARRVDYSLFAQRQMGKMHAPRLQAIMIDGRPAVIYSPEDLTAALAGVGHWGVFGYSTDSARELVVNGILHAAR